MNEKTHEVYGKLRKEILSGIIKPGQRLIEASLASRFHTNRSKVRDALRGLEQNGLIEIVPHKGATVSRPSIKDILNIYEVQSVLEGLACFLSTPRLSPQHIKKLSKITQEMRTLGDGQIGQWQKLNVSFHRLFIEESGNAKIERSIKALDFPAKYWYIMLSIPGIRSKNIEEHERIIEAASKKDAALAKKLMEEHLLRSADELISTLQVLPGQ